MGESSNKDLGRMVGPEEPEYAGHDPGTPVPEGRQLIEAQFSIIEGEDEAWLHEKRPDGTYRWCRAKRRGGGGLCRAPSVIGMNRCRVHGGNTPRGLASPHFKHGRDSGVTAILAAGGRYGPSLTPEEESDYERERLDENITSLNDEIAILRMRLKQLLELRDVGNTADAWKRAREAYKAMRRARKFDNQLAFDEAFDKMGEAFEEEVDYNYHKEITFQIEQIRKLTDTEQKRLTAMQQLVTPNEFMTALMAVLSAVKRNVSDQAEQKATLSDIQRILIGAG